jgi:hypothetical protein
MRKSEEVRSKFHELRDRRLKERKAECMRIAPKNCHFNCIRRTRDNGDVILIRLLIHVLALLPIKVKRI